MKIRVPKMKMKILIPLAIAMYGFTGTMLTLTIKDTGWSNMTANSYVSMVAAILFTGFMAGAISWIWSYEKEEEQE